jgi:hypothetical protein
MGTLIPIAYDENNLEPFVEIAQRLPDKAVAREGLNTIIASLGGPPPRTGYLAATLRTAISISRSKAESEFVRVFREPISRPSYTGVVLDFKIDGNVQPIADYATNAFKAGGIGISPDDALRFVEELRSSLRVATLPSAQTESGVLPSSIPIQWAITYGKFATNSGSRSRAILYAIVAQESAGSGLPIGFKHYVDPYILLANR